MLRPMRLAVIETAPFGGLLHYAVQLGDALADRGHEVDLLVSRDNELAGRVGSARMRPVLTPSMRSAKPPSDNRLAILMRRVGIGIRLMAAWARILFEVRRGHYDVILLNCDVGPTPVATAAYLLAISPGSPPLVHIRHNVRSFNRWGGDELFDSPGGFTHAIYRRLSERLGLIFVHGERSKRELEQRWPNVPSAIIPHGDERIFSDQAPPAAEEERILFFGDWRKVKGLPALMEAFDELVRRRPTVRLTIAGKPARQDIDPDMIKRWAAGHGDRVEVIDRYVPMEDVPGVFGRARVVTTPYFVGYQSGVVHLAMTMGRAVVAADVGDLGSSVIDGETGLLVPSRDPVALANALERVVADRELAERFGTEGRRRVLESSGWEKVAERAEQALVSLNGFLPRK